MGLFDKVLGKKDEGPLKLNQHEAFSSICVLAVASDGVVDDGEIRRIVGVLAEKRLFKGYGVNDMAQLLNNAGRNIQRRGAGVVLESAKAALPNELKETAFAMATDLVLSDGDVADKEKAFLEEFQKALGIDDGLALKIVEVMALKNRG